MDSLQPLSYKVDSLYTIPRNDDSDEFNNDLYFSSLASTQVIGLIDLSLNCL